MLAALDEAPPAVREHPLEAAENGGGQEPRGDLARGTGNEQGISEARLGGEADRREHCPEGRPLEARFHEQTRRDASGTRGEQGHRADVRAWDQLQVQTAVGAHVRAHVQTLER